MIVKVWVRESYNNCVLDRFFRQSVFFDRLPENVGAKILIILFTSNKFKNISLKIIHLSFYTQNSNIINERFRKLVGELAKLTKLFEVEAVVVHDDVNTVG